MESDTRLWDGSFKDDGRSGCGIMIKRVDRQKWLTISKIAVLLIVRSAMAAEVVGCMRAHECPRSDPLQKSEYAEHQSTNKPDPALLTVHAFFDCLKTSESQCGSVSVGDAAGVR